MKAITEKIVKSFELYLHEEERSDNTIAKYMRDIRYFRVWLGGREVDKSVVLEYKKELCERYAPVSVNSILSSLNALFMYMNWYDLKVKTLKIQRRIFADKEKELTKAEYERLLSAAKNKKNERLYYLMQTIGSTGLRISELKYVTVDAVDAGQATINCKGKIRQVFLPRQLCKMLKVYINKQNIISGPVFVTKNGKPLDRSTVWKMLKDLCESACVARSKVFPHNFRHLFAKTFYSMQKDIVRLADILGHSSIETTRIYTMETGEVHIMQIQKLGLLRC
ncbi:MAG: tyrosine-type recombinase/integrase [Clostridia bacterium]|nr:tyrosine-type recombinase/integrase [Clostridia bacterium]